MDVNERLSNITLKVGTACSKKDMDVNERLSNITLKVGTQCLKWMVAQSPNATNILFGRPKAAPN